MTVTKNKASGAIEISRIINGYLVRRVYFGYTKKEAIKLFKEELL